MAHGLPDYYRGIDVAYQALAELTNRPKYGGANYVSGFKDVTANAATVLVEMLGKGMVYGGTVWLDAALTQANSEVWLVVDGIGISNISFYELLQYNMTKQRSTVLTLNKFDGINFIYSVGISYGITFETKIGLTYFETYGRVVRVHFRFMYALI